MPVTDRCLRLFLHGPGALACGLAGLLLVGAAASSESPPRPTMDRAFKALADLMPIAFAASSDGWKAQERTVHESVATLTAAAEQLAAHGKSRDAAFQFLSDSLTSKVRMLALQVDQGDFEGATLVTLSLVDTCVGCHVRVPNPSRRDFAQTLLKGVDRASLPPFARANFETASRQFDSALQIYEKEFAKVDAPLASAEFSDALASYLVVALRVQRDPARAERALALLGNHTDLAGQLKRNLGTWRQALKDLAPALRGPAAPERAQEILDAGRLLVEFPFDGADEIHSVVASSILFRYLEDKRPQGEELARALYLLARTEARTQESFAVSDAAVYLEQAIRAAPHSDVASRAYARLELQTMLEYSVPSGVDMPDSVSAWLRELRELGTIAPLPSKPRSPTHADSAERAIG